MRRPDRSFALALALALVAAPAARAGKMCAPGFGLCTPSPATVYANAHWQVQLTSFGYSDFVIWQLAPFPRRDPGDPGAPAPIHEMFSGEWAFAVYYGGQLVWLEPCHVYPDWRTNSNFVVVTPIQFPGDSDGDGLLEGFSVIENPDLRIRIDYDFEIATDGNVFGVAMGLGAKGTAQDPYRLSNRYVLRQTFTMENISGETLFSVGLAGMVAAHPANDEAGVSSAAYDENFYSVGGFTEFFWDASTRAVNSGLTDGDPTGSQFDDVVNFSTDATPLGWDLDTYRGHSFGDAGLPTDPQQASMFGLKPVEGGHCNLEALTLNGVALLEDDQTSTSYMVGSGSLDPGEQAVYRTMLAMDSRASGDPAPACAHIEETGGDPVIRLSKGACTGGTPTAQTYDVAMGSTADLSRVPSCGTFGGGQPFDCSALVRLECKAAQHGLSQVTLDDDAHVTDLLFYLVRRSGMFLSWGDGNNVPGTTNPLFRFYFTPNTAPGIDVCGPYTSSLTGGETRAGDAPGGDARAPGSDLPPGVGLLEAAGLGIEPPRRDNGLLP